MTLTKTRIILFMTVLSLLFSGSALAENRQSATNLSLMAGYHAIDGAMNLDNEAAFGLALGYNITRYWGIEADVRYTPTQTDSGSRDIDIWALSLGGIYHFQPEKELNPYLTFGGGGLVYDLEGTSHNDEDYMGYWGGGLKYALSDTAMLRLDLRHILDFRSNNTGSKQDDADFRHHMQAMVGVTFQMGGMSLVPKNK